MCVCICILWEPRLWAHGCMCGRESAWSGGTRYLWVVSQVDLSGDVVHSANPLRKKQIHVNSSTRNPWHDKRLWQPSQDESKSTTEDVNHTNETWQLPLCCRIELNTVVQTASFTLTSSYSLLLSACRIIDLKVSMTTEAPIRRMHPYGTFNTC